MSRSSTVHRCCGPAAAVPRPSSCTAIEYRKKSRPVATVHRGCCIVLGVHRRSLGARPVHGNKGMATTGTSQRAPILAIVGIGAQSPGRGAPRQLFSLYSINQTPTSSPVVLFLSPSPSVSVSLLFSLSLCLSL